MTQEELTTEIVCEVVYSIVRNKSTDELTKAILQIIDKNGFLLAKKPWSYGRKLSEYNQYWGQAYDTVTRYDTYQLNKENS